MDPLRQLPQVAQDFAGVGLELDQQLPGRVSATDLAAREPEFGQHRHQLLLRAVVDVALDAATFLVLGADQSGS